MFKTRSLQRSFGVFCFSLEFKSESGGCAIFSVLNLKHLIVKALHIFKWTVSTRNAKKSLTIDNFWPSSTCIGSNWNLTILVVFEGRKPENSEKIFLRKDNLTPSYVGDNADNIQSCLNQDLANVNNWLIANKLTLNMTKTEFMLTGSRQRLSILTDSPTPTNNSAPIGQVTTTKSLGVLIDDKLN